MSAGPSAPQRVTPRGGFRFDLGNILSFSVWGWPPTAVTLPGCRDQILGLQWWPPHELHESVLIQDSNITAGGNEKGAPIDHTGAVLSTGRTLGPNRGVLGGDMVQQGGTLVNQRGGWATEVQFCCHKRAKTGAWKCLIMIKTHARLMKATIRGTSTHHHHCARPPKPSSHSSVSSPHVWMTLSRAGSTGHRHYLPTCRENIDGEKVFLHKKNMSGVCVCPPSTNSQAFVCKCEFVYLCLQRSCIQKGFNQVPHTDLQVAIGQE